MQLTKRPGPILFGLTVVIFSFVAANSQRIEKPPNTAHSSQDGQYVNMPFESSTELQVVQNSPHEPELNPLLIVRERQRLETTATNCRAGLIGDAFSYSEITVFDNGQVRNVNWSIPPCSDPAQAIAWKTPASGKTRQFMMQSGALEPLRSFLDLPEVKALRDFMNAGFGVGDYEIEIRRTSGVQRVPVLSLMPSHYSLKQDPTLLRVICVAKNIGGDERPTWCTDLTQTRPVLGGHNK
jgi:hypothetical protein